MDKIIIKDLALETIIGLFPWEREVKQRLLIDVEMQVDIAQAASTDNFQYVVNYADVCDRVAALADDGQFKLIETLADHIAKLILTEFNVFWVQIYVRKTDAITQVSSVGVKIERSREH